MNYNAHIPLKIRELKAMLLKPASASCQPAKAATANTGTPLSFVPSQSPDTTATTPNATKSKKSAKPSKQ